MTETTQATTDDKAGSGFPGTQEAYLEQLGLGPIELGAILFTLIEPHEGWEVAYNRWYERDHFYDGCMVGPFNFAGARWVATREEKAKRYLVPGSPTGDGSSASSLQAALLDPMAGSYLSMYWVQAGHREEWNRWAYRQFKWLHENDRMFPHRDHVHTQLYDHDGAHYRDDDPVPAALALDHRYEGLAVTIGEATGDSRDELDAWYRDEELPRQQQGTAVAQTLSFTAIPLLVEAEGVAKDEGSALRYVHLSFLEAPALEVWDDVFAGQPGRVDASGLGRVLWQSPFRPTIPGTDTYTDQLR